MAVYTKLKHSEISDFIKSNYDLGNLLSFKEIIDGIDNSNFIIETTVGKFILTIFESRIEKEELPFFMNLKLHLASKGICCPKPISNNSGDLISSIKNKSVAIVTFLSGKTLEPQENGLYKSITTKHCIELGKTLASLHNSVVDFKDVRANDLGILGWRNLFNKINAEVKSYRVGLEEEISGYIGFLEENWIDNLEGGALHVDLFPDNVFFDEDQNLSGVIDFYFAANDSFIYDLAIIINAWCFDENNSFIEAHFQAILNGYQEIRKISTQEMDFLKIALIGASMRFLLTRLHDLFYTPKDSLVKIKDPEEYLCKIRFFMQKYKENLSSASKTEAVKS